MARGPARSGKFLLAVSVLLMAVLVVAGIGLQALSRSNEEASRLFTHNLVTTQAVADLQAALDDAARAALQIIPTSGLPSARILETQTDQTLIPRVRADVERLRVLYAAEPDHQAQLNQIDALRGLRPIPPARCRRRLPHR